MSQSIGKLQRVLYRIQRLFMLKRNPRGYAKSRMRWRLRNKVLRILHI